jgi:hypothetical protein
MTGPATLANPAAAGCLELVCVKCTRSVTIAMTNRAIAEAKEKGWLFDDGDMICPRCLCGRHRH